jgi:hypothetical protein
MTNRFHVSNEKSDKVSKQLQRFIRLLQLQSPDAVIAQEIAALQKELQQSDIVTVCAIVESK